MSKYVVFKNLGKMPYKEALNIQTSLVNSHLKSMHECLEKSEVLDSLLVVEHPPTYTIGIRAENYSAADESRLRLLGAEFHRTNRGGLITFHGPGQLVAYPILNLGNFRKSIKWYVACLEHTLIETCQQFGVVASTCQHTGVWVNSNKVAAIGIHARRFVTSHGVALNCDVDMRWFKEIDPCGVVDRGVTSLAMELRQPVTVLEAIPCFLRAFENNFDCKIIEDRLQ